VDNQLGLEQTPEAYVENMVAVFREVWRVLRDDGTCWINLGDSYCGGGRGRGDNGYAGEKQMTNAGSVYLDAAPVPPGLKPKDLVGIPWRVAFALQADGWYLRSDIIWHKPNPMPESVTDRPTKAHEYLFLLAKQSRYYYDADAVRESMSDATKERDKSRFNGAFKGQFRGTPGEERWQDGRPISEPHFYNPAGRNRRTVWTIATAPYSGSHFATYPPALVEPCIKAGTSERGVCPKCGKPWERVVEKEFIASSAGRNKISDASWNNGWEGVPRGINKVSTTGWRPTCTCDAGDPIPATVLDPFVGSGTTLLVARQLGRRGVGLDLSYSYLHDQARKRLSLDALDAWANGIAANDNGYHDLPMFAEETP